MITPDCQMIDRRILQEATTLIAAGHSLTLLAGFECAAPDSSVQDGIRIHRFTYDWDDERLKKIRAFLPDDRLKKIVNRAFMAWARRFADPSPFDRFILAQAEQHRADVVHVHDLPALKPGVLLARKWGVPLVYDAHELYYAQQVLPEHLQQKYRRLEAELIGQATVVITVNEFIAALMARRYSVQLPRVIYNATEVPAGDLSGDELRRRMPGAGPIVLYQGWISGERNLDTLVRAMAEVPPPTRLAVIGYGEHERVLVQLARDLGVIDRVHFLGRVPSEEMLRYTVGADLGVIPYLPIDDNHRYCSPNKFFEYVLAGVPVLTHELPFFRMMRDRYGVVACGDLSTPSSCARAIRELIDDRRLAAMRERCRAAGSRLNWGVESEKLLQIYASLGMTDA
jgi:glycosyltransferase involved in cell wall biosynthesis